LIHLSRIFKVTEGILMAMPWQVDLTDVQFEPLEYTLGGSDGRTAEILFKKEAIKMPELRRQEGGFDPVWSGLT
jgi:hypothetical protein